MAALEDFENTLKEVVNAKRLSASKMNRLTEIAMKSLADDTKLVAVLYRTHKSLPGSAKVSSLYAFDALARAARSAANKRGTTGDIKLEKGNAATFLLKIEGVLDGLIQDMASLNNPEAKEKTKKVLDIWVKSNTFPSAVLTRLGDILSDIQKEIIVNSTPPADPRGPTEAPATITTSQSAPHVPTGAPPDVQATLLALLGKAAQITGPPSQTPPNTDPQGQLALLQQLALTAKLANGSPTPPSAQTPPPTEAKPTIPTLEPPQPSLSQPRRAGSRFDGPGNARYRNGYSDARDRHDFRDERYPRGGSRGRGRWDDRHNADRFRPRDRDLPSRQRHSRSRSPRRHEEQRNMRSSSPPRPPLTDGEPHRHELPASTDGKDEFGRDIRVTSNSPSRSTATEGSRTPAPMETSVDPRLGVPRDNHIPVSDQLPLVAASTPAQSTDTHTPSSASQQQPGLDQLDFTTFDATKPSSWEALGQMWQTTYGCPPSQEELMQFVMAGSMAAAGMMNGGFNGAQGGQMQQANWGDHGTSRGGWRGGRGRARGNHMGGRGGHGSYRHEGIVMEASEPSYAVVLSGDAESEETLDEGGKGGGRMQRVGDKWVFVRDVET